MFFKRKKWVLFKYNEALYYTGTPDNLWSPMEDKAMRFTFDDATNLHFSWLFDRAKVQTIVLEV